jgi:hypothetical protein
VGLLGRGISPTQGLYLHRTTQHRKKNNHTLSGIRIHDLKNQPIKAYASGRAATGTGHEKYWKVKFVTNIITTPAVYEMMQSRIFVRARTTKHSAQFLSVFNHDSRRTFCRLGQIRTHWSSEGSIGFNQCPSSCQSTTDTILERSHEMWWCSGSREIACCWEVHSGSRDISRLAASTSKQSVVSTQPSH